MDLEDIRADLAAEQADLDEVVAALDDAQWAQATPSPGWSVADQIGHLTYFDGVAAQAITEPDGFVAARDELFRAALAGGVDSADQLTLGASRAMTRSELLVAWRRNRIRLADAAAMLAEDDRVIWYGPSMSAKSFLTARLMEAWAHGQDVVDALGATRSATERLRHIAQLGYITRGWTYANRGEETPPGTVRLELVAPSAERWQWGPDVADDTVHGTAEDFCLVVTQRRHLDDTGLVTGELGRHWLLRAQVFAGGPTARPAPRRA